MNKSSLKEQMEQISVFLEYLNNDLEAAIACIPSEMSSVPFYNKASNNNAPDLPPTTEPLKDPENKETHDGKDNELNTDIKGNGDHKEKDENEDLSKD